MVYELAKESMKSLLLLSISKSILFKLKHVILINSSKYSSGTTIPFRRGPISKSKIYYQ